MVKVKVLPVLLRMTSKLDIAPLKESLKNADVFTAVGDGKFELSKEKVGLLAFDILSAVTPQLEKISDDLIELIAAYKDIPLEEVGELDLIKTLNEIRSDEDITRFFSFLLTKKAAAGA